MSDGDENLIIRNTDSNGTLLGSVIFNQGEITTTGDTNTANLYPIETDIYDIGSSDLKWRNLNLYGDIDAASAHLHGTLIVEDAVTFNSTLLTQGAATFNSSINVSTGHNIAGVTTGTFTHTLPDSSGYLVSASKSGVGSAINPIYINSNGVAQASTNTVGSATRAVYLKGGILTTVSYDLSAHVISRNAISDW